MICSNCVEEEKLSREQIAHARAIRLLRDWLRVPGADASLRRRTRAVIRTWDRRRL